jgi:hypothetical protein
VTARAKRKSAAARLLGLRVWFPPTARMFVSYASLQVVCCQRPLQRADPSSRGVLPRKCVSVSVIKDNNHPVHLQWVGRKTG